MVLVFDIGTSVLKGALMTGKGVQLEKHSVRLKGIKDVLPGHNEADTSEWMAGISEIAGKLTENVNRKNIRGIIISGNGPTLVPVDNNGSFLEPVMSWMDRRGTLQSEKIREAGGFYLDPTFYLPKALWIHDNLPEVFQKTRHFLSCPEAVTFRLTGETVTILPGEKFERYFWNNELLEKLNLDKSKFPSFRSPGHVSGNVTIKASKETGIPEGIPVISGGPDLVSSILGTASVFPGRCCDRTGTSEGINLCTEKFINDSRLMSYGHVIKGLYNLSGIISTTGRALDWALTITGSSSAAAAKVPAGSEKLIFLPYLSGERAPLWDPDARGAFIGLGLNHRKEHLVKAVMESAGFAVRDVIEVMGESGAAVEDLRITGGPSENDQWNQIKADITGRRITVPESSDSELTGNYVLAMKVLGEYDRLDEAADDIVNTAREYLPNRDNRSVYDDLFGVYRESYLQLKELYPKITSAGN